MCIAGVILNCYAAYFTSDMLESMLVFGKEVKQNLHSEHNHELEAF